MSRLELYKRRGSVVRNRSASLLSELRESTAQAQVARGGNRDALLTAFGHGRGTQPIASARAPEPMSAVWEALAAFVDPILAFLGRGKDDRDAESPPDDSSPS